MDAADSGDARGSVVVDLFAEEPEQWGLAGDPYLWAALRQRLSETPMPGDPVRVERALKDAFRALVGVDLDDPAAPEVVHREEFDHGGRYGGQVHLPTWRDRLVPLLLTRARELERARSLAAMKDLSDLQDELGLTD